MAYCGESSLTNMKIKLIPFLIVSLKLCFAVNVELEAKVIPKDKRTFSDTIRRLNYPGDRSEVRLNDIFGTKPALEKRIFESFNNFAPHETLPIPVPNFFVTKQPPLPTFGSQMVPGLNMFHYVVGQMIPLTMPSVNDFIGNTVGQIVPQAFRRDLATTFFHSLHPPAEKVELDRMMGRWYPVISSAYITKEACSIVDFGALTNVSYSAAFTVLKYYRENNSNGAPKISLGYGFKSSQTGEFVIHNSNSADSEPLMVAKVGPLNEYNVYDYIILSNWVRFPLTVLARDVDRFRNNYMKEALQYLENNNYINLLTKALNLISPVDYTDCEYTPTFSLNGS